MKPSPWFRGVALVAAAQFATVSCGGSPPPSPRAAGPADDAPLIQTGEQPPGLTLTISDGRDAPTAATTSGPLPPATRIPDADAQAILARLAPIAAPPADQTELALRESSQPPPRTGRTSRATFPPPDAPAAPPRPNADAGRELTVARWSPEGEVPLAANLQLTFSQPMIAVTSQDAAATSVPVTLTPTPPGRWRWLGTRTIVFDPEVRFPQATTYTVNVAKGTRSATGGVLKKAHSFRFTTPTPRVQSSWPSGGPQRLDAPMFVLFDQKIDPAAVLATTQVKVGKTAYPTRLLTGEEIAQHPSLAALATAARANQQDGRWLAFRAAQTFPKDADVTVTIGPGTASLEGPNRTKDPQSFTFKTFPPLRVVRSSCGWGQCYPGAPFQIEFNNPLDGQAWRDAQVAVTPALPSLRVETVGNYLTLRGDSRPETTYQVTVAGTVTDGFGQTLGKDEALTFRVEKAYPNFFGPQELIVLDPAAARPTFDVFTSNYTALRVQLYRVEPADWPAYVRYLSSRWSDPAMKLPGARVFNATVPVAATSELVETQISLASALNGRGLGHAIAVVEPSPWTESHDPPRLVAWVQSTRLGLDAAIDAEEMHVWVNRLGDGAAVASAEVRLQPWNLTGQTDREGTARLALTDKPKPGTNFLVARHGDDSAFLPEGWYGNENQWLKRSPGDGLTWYVTDDRQMYRPGEEVHVKGWLRVHQGREGGDLAGVHGLVSSVKYQVADPLGNPIHSGSAKVSAVGGFDLAFTLPKTPNLGYASISFEAIGRVAGAMYHGFQIQEFRRPEYEVTTRATPGPHFIGAAADVTVQATYFAGGGLADAAVDWDVSASRTTFTPPNRDDFNFGIWTPWWGWQRGGWSREFGDAPEQTWSHTAKTDAAGAHVLHLDFVSANPAVPMNVTTHASVTDVNRQRWAARSTLLVHPASAYVGIRTPRPFVDKGRPIDIDAIAVDLDGKALIGRPIDITAVRSDWVFEGGSYVEKAVEPQRCARPSAAEPITCQFATPAGGQYKITARTVDDRGRTSLSEMTIWVSGGETPPAREVEQETVQLIPGAKEYRAGQTAEVLVQAPFYPAEGVLSVRRSGVVSSQRFTMTGPTYTAKVPIREGYTPNVYVQVDLVGAAVRADADGKPDPRLPKRPAFATGSLNLPVPPASRTLRVEVAPRAAKVAPGETAEFEVVVRDAAGKPVAGSEVAIIVVDEAVLALTGRAFANPIDTFYQLRDPGAADHHSRQFIKLARADQAQLAVGAGGMGAPADMAAPEAAAAPPAPAAPEKMTRAKVGMAAEVAQDSDAGGGGAAAAIAVRTNFNPLAAWSAAMKTGGDGHVALTIKMPDNLTRYRVVAIAAHGERDFGKGESAITARMPLMVRPSAPRFLNFGDAFELPVVLQNQTDQALDVTVVARATNAALTAGMGRAIRVPANDRVEVRFPAATEMAGTARIQLAATAGAYTDAAEVALPVWTPATTEAFATYGQVDDGAIRQPIALPGKVVTAFGGLEVETSSTQLQALTDAFLYLVAYPFECSEQISSRILAIAALRDVLTAFKASGLPSATALEQRVDDDLEQLYKLQNPDGGFGFWRRGAESWPFLTAHVANAMVRAKAKGYRVRADALEQALAYLAAIEQRYPPDYPIDVRRTITAYALYTRALAGQRDIERARALIKEAGGVDKLSLEASGWLLGVLAQQPAAGGERKALLRHLNNRVSETAGAANFTTGYTDGAHLLLHSDRRADAIVLESLIAEQPASDLIPKLVNGLLGHAKAGRWMNTQENVFVLVALDHYFRVFEKLTPNFVARVWLGDGYAGEHAFIGRQTDRHNLAIPMRIIAERAGTKAADLTIQKDGVGRLYYRIAMSYAPAELTLAAADRGFAVTRRYEPIDDPGDVVRGADGAWRIKAGARVRVRLAMVNEDRRYHVALVDPLPAGLEAMNPALAVTAPIPDDEARPTAGKIPWSWPRTWFDHQNLRDERVEAFSALLWEGAHEYTYVARATTPGSFVVPPTKAEEMYFPETFGRSASDRVIVQ